jgi:type VI secretion system protein ImpA
VTEGTAIVNLDTLFQEASEAPPCGPNLEHDLSFFELEEAARVKPEQRVGDAVKPGEEPKWPQVVELAQAILGRSKDLRAAVHLTRGLIRTEGFTGLNAGLALVHGLLERYWDHVHPLLEADMDNDPTERLNALSPLADSETLVKDIRDSDLLSSREHGRLQAREVEIALGRLVPLASADAAPARPLHELHTQIAAAFAEDRTVPTALREAQDHVTAIQMLVADRVGAERSVDLKPLSQTLGSLLEACDVALGVGKTAGAGEEANGQGPTVIAGELRSRQEAIRALDLVCRYLERHEPTNPAPLFIRRAQRLMTKNFMDIVRDLLPDSLANLERLTGEPENK